MTLKRFALYGAATLTALTLASCGGDSGNGDEPTEDAAITTSETSSAGLNNIEIAGGETKILDVASQALDYCHDGTTFNGIPISESWSSFDEFQGAYVEEGGHYVRHVIAGTTKMGNEGSPQNVGYVCAYLQEQEGSMVAAYDDLGILQEEEAEALDEDLHGYAYGLREHLRRYHDVHESGDVRVYDVDFTDANKELQDTIDGLQDYVDSRRTFGDGTHLIGDDIEPGTYRNDGSTCYWERLSGLSGSEADRIENDFIRGQAIVEILPTDKAFKSQGCGTWEKVD